MTEKPRILYIIGQLERGGAEQQLYNLLKHIDPPVTVVSLSSGGYWVEPIRALGHRVIELERSRRFEVERLKRVVGILRTAEPEIIHLFVDGISGLYARIGALLSGRQNVVVGERLNPDHYPKWFILLSILLNHRVKVIVCNSFAARQSLTQCHIAPADKTLVIPNGIDLPGIQSASRVNQEPAWPSTWLDKPVVGMVGHLYPKKNPEAFIRISSRVAQIRPDARFVIVGDGPLRAQAQALAASLGLDDHFLFTGLRHDVPFLLRHMDIFVLTSRREGMPNAVLEAMAIGLPCVVSDVGDCARLVHNGQSGYVIPPADEEGFVERIVELLDDRPRREAMGAEALNMVQAYGIQQMVESYKDLYATLLSPDVSES